MGAWAAVIFGRHPHRRATFVLVVAVCWGVGLLGLDRGRMSAFQLPLVAGAGLLAFWAVGALRRRLELREDASPEEIASPSSCVVIRRLGEAAPPRPAPALAPPPVRAKAPRIEIVLPARSPVRAGPRAVPRREPAARAGRDYIPLTGI